MKIVFDVETVGHDFETLDQLSQDYFLKFAENEEQIKEAKQSLNFFPLTAQIVAIGMLDVDTEEGAVYFQNGNGEKEKFTEGKITYISGNERDILQQFWSKLSRAEQVITFNGRAFDGPFVMLRSAIHKVRAGKNLVPYRFDYKTHCDLADQLSFYDAMRRKFGLHMWCQAFNIQSPKEEGVSGDMVKDMYKAGKYQDIARYCMRDIVATRELFLYWDKFLKF